MQFGKYVHADFILDESFVRINNCSLPVIHRAVYTHAEKIRYDSVKNPTVFYRQRFLELLQHNKQALAMEINAHPKDIALTTNTTDSMNAILRTLLLMPGDEILIDMHAHISHRCIAEFVSYRAGARLVKVYSPFPIWKKQEYVDAYIAVITPRTRLVILEDICSAYGLHIPIEPIIDYCKSRRIQVLVVGTNAVAVRKINVQKLGANWYVGACHRWGLSMQGTGFIWASEDSQNLRSTIISKYNHRAYPDNFNWAGNKDYTAWLTIAKGLQVGKPYRDNGGEAYSKDLMIWAKEYLSDRFGVADIADDEMVGKMGVVMLPAALQHRNISHEDIAEKLLQHNIIATIHQIYDKKILRLTADVFNTQDDYIACADAIDKIIDT